LIGTGIAAEAALMRVADPTGSGFVRRRGLQDWVRDRVRTRDQREVARLYLDRLRAHSLGHETLQVGIDRPIFGMAGKGQWF